MEEKLLDRKWFPQALGGSGILLLLIATIDSKTSYELGLSPFYLLPIALVTWYGGFRWGTLGATLALATWLGADNLSGHHYSRPFYAFWAGADRGMAFFAFMIAIGWLSATYRRLKESNRALGKSEQHFWSLFNNSDVAMFRSRLDGSETLECNEKFLEVVGRSRKEVIGSPSVILWEDQYAREQMARELYTKERVTDLEFGIVRPNGEILRCITSLRYFRQEELVEGLIQDITERTQAEDALRASNEKFSKIYNLSPDAIDLTHLETGVQVEANQSYLRMFGHTREELIGHSTLPEDLGIWVSKVDRDRLIASIKEHGEVREFETLLRRKDGDEFDVLISSSLLEIGGERYNLSICRDITDRKSAEKQLTLSEEKFAKIYHLSPDAIDLTNLENSFHMEINPAHEKMFGYTREEIIGHTALPEDLNMWVNREDRERFISRLLEIGEVLGFEASMRRKGGEIFSAVLSSSIVEIQREHYLLTICRDLSERKAAEVALRVSEEKYSKVFQSAPLLISLSRLDNGQLLDVNDLYCQALEFTREELIGKTTIELGIVCLEDRERLTGIVQINGNAKNIDFKMFAKNGNPIFCLFSGETIDIQGQKFLISIVSDITDIKQAEEHERLIQSQLQQAQKMESLGILVAGVAHNLNNVLAIVMGTASLRQQRATDPADLESYQSITKVCRRGKDVVKSLIHFAQPTLAIKAPFELNELIREVRVLLDNTTRNRIRVIESLTEQPLWVNGDAGNINHALVNLCINSLDSMADGGTLTFRTTILSGDLVEVSVEDDGSGMTPEVLAHVMEPFYTTKEVGKGTGLGLSMTYGVVKAHGGTIDIASQPGMGTTVKIRFPLIPTPSQSEVEPVQTPTPSLASMNVFLVDDDEDVRFLMTRMLKQAGVHRVKTFSRGNEILEDLHTGSSPDVVILDQNMPGLNGTQTLGLIRQLLPDLPILISSGQPDIEVSPDFQQPKVGVISKPFTIEEIQAKLAEFAYESLDQS